MKKRFIHYIFLLPMFALCSCKEKGIRYEVDPQLDPYLQLFLQEGKKRGVDIDVEGNGLLMEFTELDGLTIGLCTYQDPLLVQIDKDYWSETTQYEDQENLRQNVVFHELGHGLLNRSHDNRYLENFEWKTIMCGGDDVDGRDWSVNFNGYRKEYYLDELFNVRTPAPEWSKKATFDGEKGALIKDMNMNTSYNGRDEVGNLYLMRDQIYTITSANRESNNIISLLSERVTGDFYFEAVMKAYIPEGVSTAGICAIYDYDNNQKYNPQVRDAQHPVNDGCNYLAVKEEKAGDQFYLVNSNCYLPIAEIMVENVYKRDDYNKYAITRHDGELFFYVNDQLIFRNDYQADLPCLSFAVILPAMGRLDITSVGVYELGTTLRSGVAGRSVNPCPEEMIPPIKISTKKLKDYRK